MKVSSFRILCGISACCLWISSTSAEVKVPAIFGDHMVLQQDRKIPIWGWAAPGEQVLVALGSQVGRGVANAKGEWRADLPVLPTNAAAQTLTIKGRNTLVFNDVLVGDVWVASGQSNMEYQMFKSHLAKDDLPKANDPQLRVFHIPKTNRLEQQTDVDAKWEVCTPETVREFSAVAYYFGADLRGNLKRPIGLIGTYWGGTPAQSWTSLSALKQNPPFTNYVQQAENNLQVGSELQADYPRLLAEYTEQKKQWDANVKPIYEPILKAWNDEAKAAKDAGNPIPTKPEPSQPEPAAPRDPNPGPQQSTVLFNGMIAPIIPYAMKGVIWYQGESNAVAAAEYRTLFPRMIGDWRQHWGEGAFPFLFVQVAAFGGGRGEENYPLLRESQAKALSLPNTGMAVTIDLGAGMDIHPSDKKDVGLRLAFLARHKVYAQKLVDAGPTFQGMRLEGSQVRLTFQNIGSGLTIGVSPWARNAPPNPVTELKGFTIAGKDGTWTDADAKIKGATVVVSSKQVAAPVAVRYAWAGDPICNLYNKEGLPAPPFRTDDLPATAEPSDANSKAHADWFQLCKDRVAAAQGKPVDLIFIGDSITQNFITEPKPGWDLVGKDVWDKYYATRHVLNFGVGADTTQDVLWRLNTMDLHSFHPKVAVILIGINNAGDTAEDIAGGVKAVIAKTQTIFPGVKVISMALLPNGRAPEKTAAANAIIRTFADNKSVFYVDLSPKMIPTGPGSWKGIGGDKVHVTREGYEIWASEIEPLLKRFLPFRLESVR